MPPAVLTSDAGAIRRLLTGDPLARRHANDVVRPLIGDGSVMLLEPAAHLARRKLLLPPFHGERVRGYAALMRRLMDEEVDRWRPGDVVAVLPTALNVTIEVILQAVLGVRDRELRGRFRRVLDDLLFYPLGALRLRATGRFGAPFAPPRRLREAAAFAASLPTPAVMTYFPEAKARSRRNVATARWWRHRDRLVALLDEQVAATRADPALDDREDVLALLVRDGHRLSAEDLRNDLITLVGAGHETTAAAIAWGASLVAHHPGARAADLGALVKEVLRIRSPIPVAAGRVLDAPFGIGEHVVPAGTQILVDAWGVHHDPERWPEPDRFRPERFVDAPPAPYTWLPFGGGAHRCLGAALAELEIRVALETILRRVGLEPADAELAPPARRGVTIVPHAGGRVRVAR
jgi:cytochrome P450